jgi:hypothetical protein
MLLALDTWRALLGPRRALPLGLLLLAALTAEWVVTRSLGALIVVAALIAAFWLVAPLAYRGLVRPPGAALGLGAYVVVCTVVASATGVVLPWALQLPGTYIADPSGFGILCALFWVGGWGLAQDIELEQGFLLERGRAERLATEAERASLLALRAQLDPHFLFNTLNAIAEWCRADPAVAEAATLRLASMLRTMLEGIRTPSWPLATELSLAKSLFELYSIRDRDRFRFRFEMPEPLPDLHVPPMIFLPLFENAITHGPLAGHTGEVSVRLRADGPALHLEIHNPGSFTGRRPGGEGIAIVERRLALAYGGGARLSVHAQGAQTASTVFLPALPLTEPA